ncbi:MAG: acylneuraminate cytidylyltransferase family protein [Muribaculaceae bacterium]|nr:acylneuraminate cytidylyltransferase family protein [Muribaculaceae bacterium]
MKPLVIIPARGGSKGIPRKNIKPLGGRPLICYAIDAARTVAPDSMIILSTDDEEIARTAREQSALEVPYMRPAELATDTAGSREMMLDAMDWADRNGLKYDCVLLLQPTSPLRTPEDVKNVLDAYTPECDMAVSVCPAACNPYYDCFETDPEGYLHVSKGDGLITRRQNAPQAWQMNGAVYAINPGSLHRSPLGAFEKRIPVAMPRERSVDLDTPLDWVIAETLLSHGQQEA